MKARIPKLPSTNGRKVLQGKGREYSAIANEVEQSFVAWLDASGITETDFLDKVNRNDLYLTFWTDDNVAITALHHSAGEIAQPLIWQKENGDPLKNYRINAALLLFYVMEKTSNPTSKEKISSFIKTELCPIS